MSSKSPWRILLVGWLASGGCGGDGPVPMEPEPPAVTADTVLVGAAGSTAVLLDGAVRLDVAAGALTAETPISVTLVETTGLDGAVEGAVFEFEPDGLDFGVPVELTIEFDPVLLATGVAVEALRLHEYTSGSPALIEGSRVDQTAFTVTGLIDGFSSYGAGEASVEALDASVDALWSRWEQLAGDPAAREATADALFQDMLALERKLSARCAASNQIPAISADLQRIAVLQERAQLIDAPVTEFLGFACGGILAEGATDIRIEPDSVMLSVGGTQQFTATVLVVQPPERTRELLGGEVLWDASEIATIGSSSGLLEAVAQGSGDVTASVELYPGGYYIQPLRRTRVTVRGPITLEVTPTGPIVFATQQWTVFDGVVRDSVTGDPVNEIEIEWEALDPSLVDVSLGQAGEGIPVLNGRKVEGVRPGSSSVRACAGEGSEVCTEIEVQTVWNMTGTWSFQETLTTQLEPPESETCFIEGTATLEQHGTSFSGTSSESGSCTYDPGDGSEPESRSFQATGIISNGFVSGMQYGYTVVVAGDVCTSSGVLSGANGLAESASGTTRCESSDGYTSSGPTNGEWTGGSHHTRLRTGGG